MAMYHRLGKPWLQLYSRFCNPNPGGFRILTFHDVPQREWAAFEKLLDFILEENRIISPAAIQAMAQKGVQRLDNEPSSFAITFDDGYASNVEISRTFLKDRGIKAVFFVCPQLLDLPESEQNRAISKCVYEGQPVSSEMRFMSWRDVEFLMSEGHTIGSHTLTHKRLSTLPAQERQTEILGSADMLRNRTGKDPEWFAYPFGNIQSIDPHSYGLIRSRYQLCCSGIRGLNIAPLDPLTLLRDSVDLSAPFEYQRLSLCGGLDFLYSRAAVRVKSYAQPS